MAIPGLPSRYRRGRLVYALFPTIPSTHTEHFFPLQGGGYRAIYWKLEESELDNGTG